MQNILSITNKPNIIPTQRIDLIRHRIKKKEISLEFAYIFLPNYFRGHLVNLFIDYYKMEFVSIQKFDIKIIKIDKIIKRYLISNGILATRLSLWKYNTNPIILDDFDYYSTPQIYQKINILNTNNKRTNKLIFDRLRGLYIYKINEARTKTKASKILFDVNKNIIAKTYYRTFNSIIDTIDSSRYYYLDKNKEPVYLDNLLVEIYR